MFSFLASLVLYDWADRLVGLRWSHPVQVFQLLSDKTAAKQQQFAVLQLVCVHIVVVMRKNNNKKKRNSINTTTTTTTVLEPIYNANNRKSSPSFHPLWKLLSPQQDRNSDAITTTVHVSTGSHKLPGTVSFTEMQAHAGKKICWKQIPVWPHQSRIPNVVDSIAFDCTVLQEWGILRSWNIMPKFAQLCCACVSLNRSIKVRCSRLLNCYVN